MASAAATGGSAWSQTYSFDGFGNLTGNGNWTQSVNAANNQISTVSYDANGNQTQSAIIGQSGNATLSYDVENRLTAMVYGTNPQVTIGQYAYNPSNQRVWRKAVENGVTAEYFYFYGLDGKREATYKVTSNAPTGLNNYNASLVGTAQDVLVYFGGETIQEGSYGSTLSLSYATADRLGSMPGGAKLDPYGQEISATANDKVKFATYLRDGESGIDYAMNRYYAAGRGRFLTADPSRASNDGADPRQWNRYTYVIGDPINYRDRRGLSADSADDSGDADDGGDDDGDSGDDGYSDDDCQLDPSKRIYDPGCYTWSRTPSDKRPPPAASRVNCFQVATGIGLPGFGYAQAQRIWNDGNLGNFSGDAATVAALAAVTWQGESGFSLNPTNNPNTNASGTVTSVDYGPFQINQGYHPNSNGAVWGTSGGGQKFNGNPDANITFGISILEDLLASRGDDAAGRYVGSPQNPSAQKRETSWHTFGSSLIQFFGNKDCFQSK